MKRFSFLLLVIVAAFPDSFAQPKVQSASLKLATRWSKNITSTNVLPEYPRPQLVRNQWQNLNGWWDYAITGKNASKPLHYEGQILVPYPIESALSGVQKALLPSQNLWYRKLIQQPSLQAGEKVMLHFGAVDWQATVFVNGKEAGSHTGGYTDFTFDITHLLNAGSNELLVKVFDPTNEGVGPHGKQVLMPENIYYTPTSGIWQTVWLETVPAAYISGLTFTPDIDKGILNIMVKAPVGYAAVVTALDGTTVAGTVKGKSNTLLPLPVKDAKHWTPATPFLYDLQVKLIKGNKTIDAVTSYFGMRKISVGKDEKGFYRIFLNNQYVYNLGILDQGFWPDGLYTAPTDEALKFDIEAIKAMGFNTIRKHIKVEPARWYYHADKLGMLVWQDFVNPNQGLPEGSKAAFEQQLDETMEQLHNFPCITTWVLFNEKWGQYDQQRLTEYVKRKDPSRLLNAHSGELLWVNEQLRSPSPDAWVSSDIADVHSYPDPMNAPAKEGRVQILGEFGGIGVFIADHQWNSSSAWGYVNEKPAGLKAKYAIMNQHLQLLEKEGLAGSIYTQPFDVEGEQNGLITYDRAVIKIPFEELRNIHAKLNPAMGSIPAVTAQQADMTEPGLLYSQQLQQYLEGKRDKAFLQQLTLQSVQVGDKSGTARFSAAYIAALQEPLSSEDMQLVSQFSKSSKDPGFMLMKKNADLFKKVIGDRQYTVNMMNMIFKGDMEPMIQAFNNPDWAAIETKVMTYGAPGEEILLRAKTIHFLNNKMWNEYVPAASAYLKKYGTHIRTEEKSMLEQQIQAHGGAESQEADKATDVAAIDLKIAEELIKPAVGKARAANAVPDWEQLTNDIAAKYDAIFAGRTVTRAQLFYYYGTDKQKFATAIVAYTEKYEDKGDLKTMHTNAGFVLQHSNNKEEVTKAIDWCNALLAKDTSNNDYKTTLAALQSKLKNL